MAFYGYNDDVVTDYDHNLFPSTYSSYEFEEPKSSLNNYYYYSSSHQFDYYYDSTEVSSTLIHYDQQTPTSYVYESFYPQTNFIINYSTLEFNETEFEEYDDTPYGGGYDIALTYGQPLPPSDQICYPRSTQPLPGSKSAIPYGGISTAKPQQIENVIKPVDDLEDIEDNNNNSNVKEDAAVEKPIEDGVDEYLSSDDGISLQSEGLYDQVPRYAYGSGLEAIDICDSIFGYWPCLEKRKQQYLPCNEMPYDQNQRDPWKCAADYLFGSGFMYEEEPRGTCRGHGYYFDGQHFEYSCD